MKKYEAPEIDIIRFRMRDAITLFTVSDEYEEEEDPTKGTIVVGPNQTPIG